jgi:hypothetical protein
MRSLENVGGGQAIQGVECFTIQGADFDFRRKSPGGDIMAAASALSLRRRMNSQREAKDCHERSSAARSETPTFFVLNRIM